MVEYRNHNPRVAGSIPAFVNLYPYLYIGTGYSAVGSASVLGIEGHRFKSYYPEIP